MRSVSVTFIYCLVMMMMVMTSFHLASEEPSPHLGHDFFSFLFRSTEKSIAAADQAGQWWCSVDQSHYPVDLQHLGISQKIELVRVPRSMNSSAYCRVLSLKPNQKKQLTHWSPSISPLTFSRAINNHNFIELSPLIYITIDRRRSRAMVEEIAANLWWSRDDALRSFAINNNEKNLPDQHHRAEDIIVNKLCVCQLGIIIPCLEGAMHGAEWRLGIDLRTDTMELSGVARLNANSFDLWACETGIPGHTR